MLTTQAAEAASRRQRLLHRLHWAMACFLLLLGLVAALDATRWETARLLRSSTRVPQSWVLTAAAGIALAGLASLRLPLRMGFACICFFSPLVLAQHYWQAKPVHGETIVGLGRVSFRGISLAHSAVMGIHWRSQHEWEDGHIITDTQFGHRGLPYASARQFCSDFYVVYHLDAEGWRVMPEPRSPVMPGEIAFLGCSFSFGVGVADEETYSYLLAAGPWQHRRVRNYSVSGYGTTHCYLRLRELLRQWQPPACVIYSMISLHTIRNYRRSTWHNGPFPLFELEGERLVDRGIVPMSEANWTPGPELEAKELDTTVALIQAMAEACRERGVTFVVAMINCDDVKIIDELRSRTGVHLLDLHCVNVDKFPADGHGLPSWHQAMARAFCSSVELREWTGLSDLYQPAAVALPTPLWRLNFVPRIGAGTLQRLPLPLHGLRIDHLRSTQHVSWHVMLIRNELPLVASRNYRLRFRGRADASRPISFVMQWACAPFTALTTQRTLPLTGDWTTFECLLSCKGATANGQLAFQLGESQVPVELADIQLFDGQTDLLAGSQVWETRPIDPSIVP